MVFGFDASQIIIILTLLGGFVSQYLSWRQHKRDVLKDDFERQHRELTEERARADSLEPLRVEVEEWKLKAMRADDRCQEAQKELEALRKQIEDLNKQIQERK